MLRPQREGSRARLSDGLDGPDKPYSDNSSKHGELITMGAYKLTNHMPTRRSLLQAAGGALLLASATLSQAQSEAAAAQPVAAAPVAQAPGTVVLDPVALAILHAARGDRSWSSRQKIRAHLRSGGPGGLFQIESDGRWASADSLQVAAAWQTLLAARDPFQRARDFNALVQVVDAYAAKVLSAGRYLLPLNGQGFMSYDYLDQQLLNDAGLVESNSRYATQRFATLDRGIGSAIQLTNLHLRQLTPAVRSITELYRVAAPDTVLAERLLRDKASTRQLVEIRFAGEPGQCVPRGHELRGAQRPLNAVAVELLVQDQAGQTLLSQALNPRLRKAGKGGCGGGRKTGGA
jgi:hypothetical protein